MDLNWERSYPYFKISKEEIIDIFPNFKNDNIIDLKLIQMGCRNSNYEVITTKGKYLLRITSDDPPLIQNEIAMNNQLAKIINLPKILVYRKRENRYFLIYEFIEGENFSQYLSRNKITKNEVVEIAEIIAKIHSLIPEDIKLIKEMDLPPFERWFDYFLSNKKTLSILGEKRRKTISNYIRNNSELLAQISEYRSFIHSDFRPANMLINTAKVIYIVDWEYCTFGHSLADIGQFFRYRESFNEQDRKLLAIVYNNFARKKIPANWYSLSRLRDLINPLQMLGSVEKKLQQEVDLLKVVDDILTDLQIS